MKDSDWIYRGYSVPWLSQDPVNPVEISGFGFSSIFDETNKVDPSASLSLDQWQFVCFWKPEFPGWNPIAFLVFRKRAKA